MLRLESLLEDAINNGWRNTTFFGLEPKPMVAKIIGLRPELSLRVLSRKGIFELVFPNSTCDWLASEINQQINMNRVQKSADGGPLTGDDITLTVATLLLAIVEPSTTFDQFVKNTHRKGIKQRALDQFIQHLAFDPKLWFQKLNESIIQAVTTGGFAALDEMMWPWKGKHVAVVFIERKPHPYGFKVLSLCIQLTHSGR
jgi:hypothetical protein